MAMKISKLQYVRYCNQLDIAREKLEVLGEEVKVARDLGDLRENSEFDAAKENYSKTKALIQDLEEKVQYEIIEYDKSNIITLGSIVSVHSPELGSEGVLLMISDVGDSFIEGVLATDSALGRVVVGNPSGDFIVDGRPFTVNKIQNPDMDEFIRTYPDEDEMISRLMNNI